MQPITSLVKTSAMSFMKNLFSADNIIDNVCAWFSTILILLGVGYLMFFTNFKHKIVAIVLYGVVVHYLFRGLYKLMVKIFKIKQI